MRRHSDQIVSAHLNGFFSHQASLFVRYASATAGKKPPCARSPMARASNFCSWASPKTSNITSSRTAFIRSTAKLTAVDLPQVTHLRVTYHFPAAYGRKDETEDPGGDLRAIAGTVADLDIETDKPLSVRLHRSR